MKILNETKVMVIAKAEPTVSRDGQNTYYKIAVIQNKQACNLSVSRDVYDSLPNDMCEVTLATSYDDQYKSFRVDGIAEIHSINGVKQDKPSGGAHPATK